MDNTKNALAELAEELNRVDAHEPELWVGHRKAVREAPSASSRSWRRSSGLHYTGLIIREHSLRPSNLAQPYGMTLSRFANRKTVELIGKYKVDAYDPEPTRVCRVIVDKAERKAVIDINGDEKLIVKAACGTPSMLEYCAVKALKGYLQFRIAFNAHKVRQRKRRRAEKRAKPAGEVTSCE